MLLQSFVQASGSLQLEGTEKYKNANGDNILSWFLLCPHKQNHNLFDVNLEKAIFFLRQKILKALVIQLMNP